MYLIAIVLPPVAVLICGKPVQALLNILLCLMFVIPGMVHAIMVVSEYKAEQRTDRIVRGVALANRGERR